MPALVTEPCQEFVLINTQIISGCREANTTLNPPQTVYSNTKMSRTLGWSQGPTEPYLASGLLLASLQGFDAFVHKFYFLLVDLRNLSVFVLRLIPTLDL